MTTSKNIQLPKCGALHNNKPILKLPCIEKCTVDVKMQKKQLQLVC